MTTALTVLAPGPLTTVQDAGRPGLAALGVGRSGACDRASYALANRLVGNDVGAAALEVTLGGLALRAERDVVVALAGARCPGTPHDAVVALRAGDELRLGAPEAGLRTYVAVRGGVDVPAVLGSRSTDVLSGLGPAALRAGDALAAGPAPSRFPDVDVAPVPEPAAGDVVVRVLPGPRRDWFSGAAWAALTTGAYAVTSESNRVGVRLEGAALERARDGELPSEGMVRGALQVPPSGEPVLFLADHPVTGGYPVIGCVVDADVDRCAQLCPGQRLLLRPAR
ncbi:biotin-dependent carboxyltransferase family protein [uncultured Pseudokineococcus sp.]|uniref:5-oxoprolinase subunit C family protein n=1 Tax=uncultured Pseudokineococcus sp. TaxID=1642928 RepID=UPI00260B5614|nr:biotin-dependent carboxyltransferase family protein [uncultured Pseudokineococcus sp.]